MFRVVCPAGSSTRGCSINPQYFWTTKRTSLLQTGSIPREPPSGFTNLTDVPKRVHLIYVFSLRLNQESRLFSHKKMFFSLCSLCSYFLFDFHCKMPSLSFEIRSARTRTVVKSCRFWLGQEISHVASVLLM